MLLGCLASLLSDNLLLDPLGLSVGCAGGVLACLGLGGVGPAHDLDVDQD